MTRAWRSQAACRGKPTRLWFALPRTPEANLAAQICAECPVAEPCASEAKANKELGRWGDHVRLVDKYRSTRVEIRQRPVRCRDGLWRCYDCGDQPFLSEYALEVHWWARHRELSRAVGEFESDMDALEAEAG